MTTYKRAVSARRKAALEANLHEIGNPFGQRGELQLEACADPLDHVRSDVDREIVVSRLDDRTRRMHDLEAALAKLADGSYGVCERCEEPINPQRLDAVPWARLCVKCQSQAEARSSFGVAA